MDRYSTLGNRIVALIIDVFVISPVVIISIYASEFGAPEWVGFLMIPLESVIIIGYTVLLHWKYGQTVGKMVAKVKVVDISEGPITFGQALLRDIAFIVDGVVGVAVSYSLIFSGFGLTSEEYRAVADYLLVPISIWLLVDTIVCLRSPKRRALHDLIAGTVVLRLDFINESVGLNLEPPPPEQYSELAPSGAVGGSHHNAEVNNQPG
jgi:uncharacterized RDD family membrane protein YckC